MIFDIRIKITIKFGTAKSINTNLMAKNLTIYLLSLHFLYFIVFLFVNLYMIIYAIKHFDLKNHDFSEKYI